MAVLELKDVSFVYGKGTPYEIRALNHINASIERNRITGIIGHTGSGKSTLVQLLNGLEKPTEGEVLLDGVNIWQKPKEITKVRFRVGLVMQYPEYQLFEETVEKDIAYGPKNMKLSEEEIRARVSEAAGFTGLDAASLSKSPFELSGGQKRRAAIAGIMAMRPEVLVLDEPAAGLDPAGRNTIFGGIRKYAEVTGSSVVIVSHSMEDIARYCDNVIVMYKGTCLMQGTKDDIFARGRKLEEVGLAVPQITKLMMLLADAGIPVPTDIRTVEDAERALCAVAGETGAVGQ